MRSVLLGEAERDRQYCLFAHRERLLSCATGAPAALLTGMVAVIPKRTPRQVQKEIQAMSKAAKKINKSAATARKFLREHGFITKDNKVSAHYR